MKYGICLLSLIPQRSEPSEKSEMVNQLLFGDSFSIIEETSKWFKIRIEYDSYEGWIDKKMATEIDEAYFLKLKHKNPFVNKSLITVLSKCSGSHQLLTPGSSLYDIEDATFKLANNDFEIISQEDKAIDFETLTTQFLNTPYLWGGKSIFGIDCSGFVQVIYKILGIKLPRDASEQSKVGSTVSFIQEAKMGDLAYFNNEEGNIIHVGILLGNEKIIHASGCVRIDNIDIHGIFNSDLNAYSHTLKIIKRPGDNFHFV